MPKTLKKIKNANVLQAINLKIGDIADSQKRLLESLQNLVALQDDREGILQRAYDEGTPGSFVEVNIPICNLMDEAERLIDTAKNVYEIARQMNRDPGTWATNGGEKS